MNKHQIEDKQLHPAEKLYITRSPRIWVCCVDFENLRQ